jgi:hypothetical protein
MISHIRQLREQTNDKKMVMEKLFNDMVAKNMKDSTGFDNMSAILLEFN